MTHVIKEVPLSCKGLVGLQVATGGVPMVILQLINKHAGAALGKHAPFCSAKHQRGCMS